MVSRKLRTAWCAIGILAAAGVASAQSARGPAAGAAADAERQLLERIEREEARNGPHSQTLIEPLSELVLLARENGDDALAYAAIERVLQVVRVNDGLFSLDQVPLIRQLIAIEESYGNAAAAWDLEQRVLALARRHPDDLRTVPVFRAAAEKRVELLARFEAGENPPQIELGCYRGWPRFDGDAVERGRCGDAGSKREAARAIVSDAQRHFAEAIAVLLHNEQYSSEALRALETGLLDTTLAERGATRGRLGALFDVNPLVEPWRTWTETLGGIAHIEVPNPTGLPLVPAHPPDGPFDYLLGRESLVRQFAYELATPAAPSVQIEAFLRIADWDLLHGWNALASGEYEQVYRLLSEHGAGASIDGLFSPALPVVLPAHRPNPLATAASEDYVDVEFEITRYGNSRRIEIRGATGNVSAADTDAFVSLIRGSRFRPRSRNGEPARAAPVAVRYYVNR